MKKPAVLLLLTVLVCCLTAPVALAQREPPMFPWQGYTLGVTLCTDNTDLMNGAAASSGKLVLVRLSGMGTQLDTAVIESYSGDFSLRCGDWGTCWAQQYILSGVSFDAASGLFSTDPEQGTFDLLFEVPADADMSTLTLQVATSTPGETILVNLADVPH